MRKKMTGDWVLRFIKGVFIGSGFILPGVSGGALAAIFGLYEKMIAFLAHITRDFKQNVLYFLPVGLGGVTGVILFSFVVSYFLGAYEVQVLWLFIGCIIGTVPSLWKQAGKKGRSIVHFVVLAASFFFCLLFLLYGERLVVGGVQPNIGTWTFAGALIGLGMIVPGLSPSNFLVYMGMYKALADGIKGLDLGVILPVAIGGIACVLLLSKAMHYISVKAYTGFFHFIVGIVLASTVMIVPREYDYRTAGTLVCALMFVVGIALGDWMSSLEERYKPS